MAAPSCIPSLMTSPFQERFAQESFAGNGQLNATGLQQQLVAFLQKLHKNPGEELTPVSQPGGKVQDLQSNPLVSFATTPNTTNPMSPTIELSQAQQLLLLLSNLPFQTDLPKSTEGVTDNNATGLPTSRPTPPTISPNILQQLLSGADITEVRTRSGLIESSLPTTGTGSTISVASSTIPTTSRSGSPHSQASSSQLTPSNGGASSPRSIYVQPSSAGNSFNFVQATTQGMIPLLQLPTTVFYPPTNQLFSVPSSHIPNLTFAEQLLALLIQLEKTLQLGKANAPMSESPPLTSTQLGNGSVKESTDPVIITSYPFRLHQLLTTNTPTLSEAKTILGNSCLGPRSAVGDGSTQSVNQVRSLNSTQTTEVDQRNSTHDRPRCHSDGHNRIGYRHKLLRPRSNSKVEQSMKPLVMKDDSETLTKELESSLFAQLVLSTDSSVPTKTKLETSAKAESNQSNTSDSDLHGRANHMELSVVRDTPPPGLLCSTKLRGRIFEWLREADLFVAEHCWDIPLGTLLATAISPGQTALAELCTPIVAAGNSDPASIPSTAKRAVARLWHQFLLVALMEHNCIPQPSQNGCTTQDSADGSCSMPEQLRCKSNVVGTPASNRDSESTAPDWFLCNELRSLVTTAAELKLDADIYKSIRFCILAQSAYPRHFATSYSEAISKLEMRFTRAPLKPASFTEVLKLLNRLHCFDAGTLKQYFCLVSDHANPAVNHSSPNKPLIPNLDSCAYGVKRKACCSQPSSTRPGSIDRDPSPVHMRSRAYTTNSYNKSARLVTSSGRDRSNTVPSESRR